MFLMRAPLLFFCICAFKNGNFIQMAHVVFMGNDGMLWLVHMYDKLICILCRMHTIRIWVFVIYAHTRACLFFVKIATSQRATRAINFQGSVAVYARQCVTFLNIRAFCIFRFVVYIFTVSPFMRANCHSDDFYVCVFARRQSPEPTGIAEPCADVTGDNFTI